MPSRPLQQKRTRPVTFRLDKDSKRCLAKAAGLRRVSISDYVCMVVICQARREIRARREQAITLTPEEQLSFWQALNGKPRPTRAQRHLGSLMRGRK